jgi:hypothetical protein
VPLMKKVAFGVCKDAKASDDMVFGSLLGLILIILGAAVLAVFNTAEMRGYLNDVYWPYVGMGATLVLVVLPLFMLFYKLSYIEALISWVVSLGVVLGLVVLLQAGWVSFLQSHDNIEMRQEHKRRIDRMVDGM